MTQPDGDDGSATGRADEDGEPDDLITYEPPDVNGTPYSSDLGIVSDEPSDR